MFAKLAIATASAASTKINVKDVQMAISYRLMAKELNATAVAYISVKPAIVKEPVLPALMVPSDPQTKTVASDVLMHTAWSASLRQGCVLLAKLDIFWTSKDLSSA